MTDEFDTQGVPDGTPQQGPGERLRVAREQRDLSVEQVGQRLNLEARQVRALEEDDWARLPEPIYVAGYLRNYARLVGLPEQEIVGAYPHRPREPFEPSGPVVPPKPAGQPAGGKLMGVVGAVLVIAAMVLIVLWWLGRFETEREVPPMSGEPASEAPAPQGRSPLPQQNPASEPDPAPADVANVPLAPQADPEPAEDPAPASSASEPEPQSREFALRGNEAAPPPPTPEAAPASPPVEAAQPAPEAAEPQGRLVLRFAADSWTEVADATGRSLAYDLVRGGNTLELQGVPPLKVFLGYAPGVTVEYNGEAVEAGRYTRNDVARFSVGREGGAR